MAAYVSRWRVGAGDRITSDTYGSTQSPWALVLEILKKFCRNEKKLLEFQRAKGTSECPSGTTDKSIESTFVLIEEILTKMVEEMS